MDKFKFLGELLRIKTITNKEKFEEEVDKLKDVLEDLQFKDRENKEPQYFSLLLYRFSNQPSLDKNELSKQLTLLSETLIEFKNKRHDLTDKSREISEELKAMESNIVATELNIAIYEDLKSIFK